MTVSVAEGYYDKELMEAFPEGIEISYCLSQVKKIEVRFLLDCTTWVIGNAQCW